VLRRIEVLGSFAELLANWLRTSILYSLEALCPLVLLLVALNKGVHSMAPSLRTGSSADVRQVAVARAPCLSFCRRHGSVVSRQSFKCLSTIAELAALLRAATAGSTREEEHYYSAYGRRTSCPTSAGVLESFRSLDGILGNIWVSSSAPPEAETTPWGLCLSKIFWLEAWPQEFKRRILPQCSPTAIFVLVFSATSCNSATRAEVRVEYGASVAIFHQVHGMPCPPAACSHLNVGFPAGPFVSREATRRPCCRRPLNPGPSVHLAALWIWAKDIDASICFKIPSLGCGHLIMQMKSTTSYYFPELHHQSPTTLFNIVLF
jgi:hypothetical protein